MTIGELPSLIWEYVSAIGPLWLGVMGVYSTIELVVGLFPEFHKRHFSWLTTQKLFLLRLLAILGLVIAPFWAFSQVSGELDRLKPSQIPFHIDRQAQQHLAQKLRRLQLSDGVRPYVQFQYVYEENRPLAEAMNSVFNEVGWRGEVHIENRNQFASPTTTIIIKERDTTFLDDVFRALTESGFVGVHKVTIPNVATEGSEDFYQEARRLDFMIGFER